MQRMNIFSSIREKTRGKYDSCKGFFVEEKTKEYLLFVVFFGFYNKVNLSPTLKP
jgi:hypothetical protein